MTSQKTNEFQVVSAGEEFFVDDSEAGLEWRLIFLGVAPGVFRIGYREYSDGSIRSPFTLDLTFCVEPNPYFTVMGERFQFSRADNDALAVQHLGKQSSGASSS